MDIVIIANAVLLPLTQNLLYDGAKFFVKKIGSFVRLNRIIRNSVNTVSGKLNKDMKNAIIESIIDSIRNCKIPKIEEIVERELKEWGEENADITGITTQICASIIEGLDGIPELRNKIASHEIVQLGDILKEQQKQIGSLYKKQIQTDQNIITILKDIKKLAIDRSLSDMNSHLIPDEYKDHFSHDLFLEEKLSDGKKATLKDLYIPNTFRILDFPHDNKNITYDNIDDFIFDFINGKLNTIKYHTRYSMSTDFIRVLFIKGLPGSGKSSFFYHLADKKAHDPSFFPNHQFYFIKLIEVYNAANKKITINNPLLDIEKYIGFDKEMNPQTVIVLDGLDEICVAKDVDISTYCNNIIDTAMLKKIHLIITTRVNYINITHSENKNVFNIQLINLSIEQLKTWCNRYFMIHSTLDIEKENAEKNIAYMETHDKDDLVTIYAVPLLFYMIVVAKINIERVKSIGELYDAVFEELQNRNYDEADIDSVQKPQISKRISTKLARQIAIEISFKMYSINELLLKVNSSELKQALNSAYSIDIDLIEDDKKDIEKMFPMTFFYKDSEDVVEFAHKSIMEFFTAEKLFQDINKYDGDMDSYIQDYIVNPIIITKEVLDFFTYFSSKDNNTTLKDAFPDLIANFMTMIYNKKAFDNLNISYTFETSMVVFKFYWYIMRNIIHENASEISKVINNDITRKFLLGVLSINHSNSISFLNNSAVSYDFSGLTFNNYEFTYSHLEYCIFDQANMYNCSFSYSNLQHTSFQMIEIDKGISFLSCDLSDSIMNMKKKPKKKETTNKDENQEINHIKEQDETSKKTNGSSISGQFIGCTLDRIVIKDMNISLISFESIISMSDANIVNTTLTLSQLFELSHFLVSFERIKLVLSDDDYKEKQILLSVEPEKRMTFLKEILLHKQEKGFLSTDYNIEQLCQQITKISFR